MEQKPIIEEFKNVNGEFAGWGHYCPGCKMYHVFDNRWTFNNDQEKPTFMPSMKVTYPWGERKKEMVCHYWLKNGVIEYLGDCTHVLKNQKVELKHMDDYD